MKKRIVSCLIICFILFSMTSVTVQAVKLDPIFPQWANVVSASADISFTGENGNVTISINGKNGVSNITADIQLYYKDSRGTWIEIEKDWNYSVNQMMLIATETFIGVSGREYKIDVDIKVKKGTSTETIFKTASAVCP